MLDGFVAKSELSRGTAALDGRQWAEALSIFQGLSALDPENAEVLLGLARALFHDGQCDAALETYRRARAHGLDPSALRLYSPTWGSEIRASELPAAADGSPTLRSLVRFMGDTPFKPGEELAFMLEELDRRGIEWISRLADHDSGAWPLARVTAGTSCLTMGPLEGALEWHLAGLGALRVRSVEGYRPNYLKCKVLCTMFPDLPMEFAEGDVSEVPLSTAPDLVFCCGVLYHVEEPQLLVQKLRDLEPALCFISTQLACAPSHPGSAFRRLQPEAHIEHHGRTYRGRHFVEGDGDYLSGLDVRRPSFWLYPRDLRRLLTDVGFVVKDAWVVDVRELGVCGMYVCAAPEGNAAIARRFSVEWTRRLSRRVFAVMARVLPTKTLVSVTTLKG